MNQCPYQTMNLKAKKLQHQLLEYTGTTIPNGSKGYLEIIEDGNCCAPTLDQAYCFEYDTTFWMMDLTEFEKEYKHFKIISKEEL